MYDFIHMAPTGAWKVWKLTGVFASLLMTLQLSFFIGHSTQHDAFRTRVDSASASKGFSQSGLWVSGTSLDLSDCQLCLHLEHATAAGHRVTVIEHHSYDVTGQVPILSDLFLRFFHTLPFVRGPPQIS